MKKILVLLTILTLIQLCGCGQSSVVPPTPSFYIKLGFVNESGLVASRIHVVIAGQNSSGQDGFFDLSQNPAVFVVTTDMSTIPDTTLDILLSRGLTIIPYINSGRIYLGLDSRVGDETTDFNQQNSSTGIIYDKVELTVTPNNGSTINLTQVDYFCMPLKLTCGSTITGFNDGITRQEIFNDFLAAESGDWLKLLLTDSNGKQLRILNPAKIAVGDTSFGSLTSYFDAIIDEYWASGHSVTVLTEDIPSRQIIGTSDGSILDFGADGSYTKPTTLDMFGQAVDDTDTSIIVEYVSCAINRGVIKNPDVTDQSDSSKFYDVSAQYNNNLYNYYAQFFHRPKYCVDSLAYALAFDDLFGYSSTITIPDQGTVTIQLQPFE